jgi:hypothetical protein
MIKTLLKLCVCYVCIICGNTVNAQEIFNSWSAIEKVPTNLELFERTSMPSKFSLYELKLDEISQKLTNVVSRQDRDQVRGVVIGFPDANGINENYEIYDASVLEESLQNELPNVRSFIGYSIKNPKQIIRFSISLRGLNAIILNGVEGTQYLDSYSKNGLYGISYIQKEIPQDLEGIICHVLDDQASGIVSNRNAESQQRNADDGILRDFELALACTEEFSSYWVGQLGLNSASDFDKKDGVLSVLNDIMTRVNAVYEIDLGLAMTIVANNRNIIFLSDTFLDNDDLSQLLDDSQTWIDLLLFQDYDIGHMLCTSSGGLAQLFTPCSQNNAKAASGTFSGIPSGYSFESTIMHEMGHQFGAFHTYNSNACAGPSTPSSAYEPGGGTTIMSYAGICASSSNIQANADRYFHQNSILQMWSFVSSPSVNCDDEISTSNNAPVSGAGNDYTIPAGTPYKLEGTGSDADGDASLTYCWEEFDLGASGLPTITSVDGPIVRSFPPEVSSVRYIPRLEDYLNNVNNSTTWEKLTLVNRDINFRLTVRDNDARGGQTAADAMVITVDNSAGPFNVTSQNTTDIIYQGGSTQTVTWNVSNSDSGAINESLVNILLSTDGGLNYDVILSDTANDGSTDVVLPNIEASNCRVMVAAANNIFFNINTNDFVIEQNLSISEQDLNDALSIYPNPANESIFINFRNIKTRGQSGISIYDLRGRLIFNSVTNMNASNNIKEVNVSQLQSGVYLLKIDVDFQSVVKRIIIE